MLGGLDPVIIFQFSALAPSLADALSKIPVIAKIPTLIDQPPIPIYLSETVFNIVIDGESKSVDIETTTETMSDGSSPDVNQKGIQSSVEINIEGKKDSVALTLLSALVDIAFDKVTSKEYAITYLHGATTVFRAVLHTYSVETVPGTDKLSVKIGLSRGQKNPSKPSPIVSVPGSAGVLPGG
jgi:hypothetical protein